MSDNSSEDILKQKEIENREWMESLEYIINNEGPQRVKDIFRLLQTRAGASGITLSCPGTTPYINTIPLSKQPRYPGNREIERRIKSINRWNAMAMVVQANRRDHGIGGHISTYASQATLFEVAFNHFLKAKNDKQDGDIVFFQGHASPGIYARAFLEGEFSEKDLENFRRELKPEGGLSSYPHPWLMPNFWQYPTVSMGLASIMAIYQARFNHYLKDRGLKDTSDINVWAFLGDGEMDEPESMGALTLAAREELDNLIFVVNCNLQRLDGPVRGNGKIIQELESAFRGAGWHVIKVIWGDDWDPLLEKDKGGFLVKRMDELLDGQLQKYTLSEGSYIREDFFGKYPQLLKMVEHYSDEQLSKMRRGGHDPEKVYAAYTAALEYKGAPTVILALTIKGYGLGEAGEGKNITHKQKELNHQELIHFRGRFGIPISDEEIDNAPFYKPPPESEEMRYLHERRKALGGYLPRRTEKADPIKTIEEDYFREFYEGTGEREVSSTMAFVRILTKLLQHKETGKRIVPIVPDESRTFGMEPLFRQVGIYSHTGQKYEPVDRESLLYYKESKDGALFEEGITEAGSLSSFIASGTAYSSHGFAMIPFFIFYSMFGFQRVGDFIWAAGDARAKGFLIGGTSGRTTLPGEGLQHQDGNSHILAYPVPNLKAYDPAFAYELAVIIRDGLYRMYEKQEALFYYITVMNEPYVMPAMPPGVKEGILKGVYRYRKSKNGKQKVNLLGSGAILRETLTAAEILENEYQVGADVWSVTSYKELYMNALECERKNRLHPGEEPVTPYVQEVFKNEKDNVFVAATDYIRAVPASISGWIPGPFITLGTDGYGRSDTRSSLRRFFEVDTPGIVIAALHGLARKGVIDIKKVKDGIKRFNLDPEKASPLS